MKIITKRIPCKVIRGEKNKPELVVEFEKGTIIEGADEAIEELSAMQIAPKAQELSLENESTKRIKLTFMKVGDEGTIDLKYLVS